MAPSPGASRSRGDQLASGTLQRGILAGRALSEFPSNPFLQSPSVVCPICHFPKRLLHINQSQSPLTGLPRILPAVPGH